MPKRIKRNVKINIEELAEQGFELLDSQAKQLPRYCTLRRGDRFRTYDSRTGKVLCEFEVPEEYKFVKQLEGFGRYLLFRKGKNVLTYDPKTGIPINKGYEPQIDRRRSFHEPVEIISIKKEEVRARQYTGRSHRVD